MQKLLPLQKSGFFIGKMTIKQARTILGKLAIDISDEELEKDIEAATLLKDLFFDRYIERRKVL